MDLNDEEEWFDGDEVDQSLEHSLKFMSQQEAEQQQVPSYAKDLQHRSKMHFSEPYGQQVTYSSAALVTPFSIAWEDAPFKSQHSSHRDLQSSSSPELSYEQIFQQQGSDEIISLVVGKYLWETCHRL